MEPTNTIKVLLVDDDAEFAEVVRHYLHPFQGKQFLLTWESSAEMALESLKSASGADVVLMDYFLQSTNGVEVAKQIAAEGIKIPIILLTSNKDFRVAIEAMKYGAEDFLIKEEATEAVLPRTIIATLERNRLSEQITVAEKDTLASEAKVKTVQELVVTMCHEFNNPLAAIKISADILLKQNLSAEEKQLLSELNKNIARLETQIVKLRDLTESSPA